MNVLLGFNLLLAAGQNYTIADVIWWVVVLMLLVLAMGIAGLLLKQKLSRKKKDETNEPIYTLHQIRKMLKKGEITQQEFDKLKEIVNTQTRKTGPLGS